jgi:hypothetical protein
LVWVNAATGRGGERFAKANSAKKPH